MFLVYSGLESEQKVKSYTDTSTKTGGDDSHNHITSLS